MLLKVFSFLSITFLLSACLSPSGNAPGDSIRETSSLEQEVEQIILETEAHPGTGVAIAVFHKDQIVFQSTRGLRDRASGLPVNSKTTFPLASVSKSISALLMNQLADEGALDLEAPIRNYLPTFQMSNAEATQFSNSIDLLSHRTGLPAHGAILYSTDYDIAKAFSVMKDLEFYPSIGLRDTFIYNNLTFMAAGLVAEQVGGLPLCSLYQQKIFTPLGMSSASCGTLSLATSNVARPHVGSLPIAFLDTNRVGAAGAVNANIEDMGKYLSYMVQTQTPSAQKLFEAHNPYSTKIHYGLGWSVAKYSGFRHIIHEGHMDGITTMVSFIPEKQIGVVVLINAHKSLITDRIERFFYSRLAQVSLDARSAVRDTRYEYLADSVPNNPVFAGAFTHPAYGDLNFYTDGPASPQLFIKWFNRWYRLQKIDVSNYDMMFTSVAVPQGENLPLRITFVLDGSGKAASLSIPLVTDLPITFLKK